MVSLSIVIPAFNEARRLPHALDRILDFVASREWAFVEVLVVDDGSTDATPGLVTSYQERCSSIRLLSNPGNRGKGYAVRHGMLKAQGEWRLFSDADLSVPIEEFDKVLAEARSRNAEIAFGSRALDRRLVSVHQAWTREMSGRFFNLVMRLSTGLPWRDTQCGFKLYSARAAQTVFSRQQIDGFGFDVEDLFIARLHGIAAVEVPVRWANVEGTSVRLSSGVRAFADLLVIRRHQLAGCYR